MPDISPMELATGQPYPYDDPAELAGARAMAWALRKLDHAMGLQELPKAADMPTVADRDAKLLLAINHLVVATNLVDEATRGLDLIGTGTTGWRLALSTASESIIGILADLKRGTKKEPTPC